MFDDLFVKARWRFLDLIVPKSSPGPGPAIAARRESRQPDNLEPLADIIVKGGCGRPAIPADGARFLPIPDRQIDFYGQAPRQAAADGGCGKPTYNLGRAKAPWRSDLAFHKKAGLASRTWSRATGSTASCATSEPHEFRGHLVFEARLWSGALHLARLKTASGHTSSPQSSPTCKDSFDAVLGQGCPQPRHPQSSSRLTDLNSDQTRMPLCSAASAASSRVMSRHTTNGH